MSNVDTAEDEGHDKDPLIILAIHRPDSIEKTSQDKGSS